MSITVSKSDNFSDWYNQIALKGKFITYYDISGYYVLLPNSYGIWENIQAYMNTHFKKLGIENSYFPLFITERNLSKEKNHIEGFTPEVVWIKQKEEKETKEDEKNKEHEENKEENRIAIRPTSECAIYPVLANLIQSYSDLPMKLHQWCSIVRSESKQCTFFIRQKEFLWNEAHACYSTETEARNEALIILDLYDKVYTDLLAIPTIKGIKTENEKFAGAESTYTMEAYIPISGKAVQSCTSHYLSTNFSKMFNISFQDTDGQNKYVHQISCGITTRSIGIMLMTHGDNKGAIVPPLVASTQIVIIPILFKNKTEVVLSKCEEIKELLSAKYRVKLDQSNHNPGWKYNYWEIMGVPLRIEIGPKDIENNTMTLCKRTDSKKSILTLDDTVFNQIDSIFADIHTELYTKAKDSLMTNINACITESEFEVALDSKKICYINWCNSKLCEENIKEKYKAKSLCIPFDLDIELNDAKCMCGNDAINKVLFGRSY